MAWEERCSTVITQWRWAPPSTNCPTTSTTNYSWCPDWVTNWWVVSHPGYSASDRGTYVPRFQPTNCGTGTITFYGVWTNNHPCGDTNAVLGGTTSISKNFTVVNVDIAEDEKTVCACETANFTLTNSCGGAVTWEVVPNGLPGEPYVSGNSIIAGTNCGSWLVLARSTVNSNCLDYAWLHVFTVAGLAPEGLTRQGTNEPPTYITCPRATKAVDRWLRVTATSCPGVWEAASCTNLPSCWQITGGHRAVVVANGCTNRLTVEVDLWKIGAHRVTASAGCSSNTVVIVVQDTNPPALNCRDLTLCTAPGQCVATNNLRDYITADDDCGVVTVTFNPTGPFNLGTNSVTATATDLAGNTTNCTFQVIVNDCEHPHITCPGNIVVCADPSGTNIVTWLPPSARDNCAVTNITYNPASGSDFPVGETTVTCTATDSSGNQSYCAFTVTVVKVDVTNIKFNHDTGSSATDAINIRQDYATPYDISNAEWIQGGANLPVCYVANRSVTIRARLTVQPVSVTSAEVWAVSTDANGSLGDVVKTTVTFSGGVSSPEYVTFNVSGTTTNSVKKTTETWQWKTENINGSGSAACAANSSGPHTVYTILAEPVTPWTNTAGSHGNAWTKALEFTIVSASCDGDSTASAALAHIAQYLHTGHGLTYDINGGRAKYASSHLGGTMDLTGYIDKSSTRYGTAGNVINCYDQAAALCTLAGVLGISTDCRFKQRFGDINIVNLVGEGNCNNPFYPTTTSGKIAGSDAVWNARSAFGNHAYVLFGGQVFDACAGPNTGTRTETQYFADTIDTSTPPEAAAAAPTTITSGAVTDVR